MLFATALVMVACWSAAPTPASAATVTYPDGVVLTNCSLTAGYQGHFDCTITLPPNDPNQDVMGIAAYYSWDGVTPNGYGTGGNTSGFNQRSYSASPGWCQGLCGYGETSYIVGGCVAAGNFFAKPFGNVPAGSCPITMNNWDGSYLPVSGGQTLPGEGKGGGNLSEASGTQNCHCDPVNTSTGALFTSATDLAVPGRGFGLAYSRTYDTQSATSTGRLGYGWTDSYGMKLAVDTTSSGVLASAGLLALTQENGSITRFTRNADGSYGAPSRVSASLVQNADGTFTFTRRARDTFTFDSTGRLTAEQDVNGNRATLAYDSSGRLSSVTEPAGRALTWSYDANSRVGAVTDSSGRTVSYGYDTAGQLTSVTDPAGRITGYGYDSNHLLTTITNPRGGVTTTAYDAGSRAISQKDPAGRITTFSYGTQTDIGSWIVTITDPLANVTRETYDHGDLVGETKAAGTSVEQTSTHTYDPVTNSRTSTTDPLGHVTSWTYDAAGNQLSATDALGHSSSVTYNGLNEPLIVTDLMGVQTSNTYDSAGHLLSTSTPLVGSSPAVSATTTRTYGDPAHPADVTAVTDPRGKTSQMTYDGYGQLIATVDPLGRKTTIDYTCTPAGPGCRSNIGWAYRTVNPKGNLAGALPADDTRTVTRNDDGQVLTSTDPLGHVTTTAYDSNGNPATVKDANNHITTFTYNADDQTTDVQRPDGTHLGTGYDGAGNRTSQTDAGNHLTGYTYDPLNRVSSTTDPLNRTKKLTYDLANHLLTFVDAAARTTTYGYDNAGRRTSVSYSDGVTPNVTFGYDNAGRRNAMTDGSGSSSYTYDSLGRMTATTNGAGRTNSYGYDLGGNRTSISYSPTQTVTRAFDDAGELTGVTDWQNHTSTFSYDADGNDLTTGYANGVKEATTVDKAGQTTVIADTVGTTSLASYSYTRDPIGQLNATTPTGTTGQTNETYGHSTLNQLTGFTSTPTSGTYRYDSSDNPTTLADPTATVQAFDAGSQLTSGTPTISLVGTAKAGDAGTTSALTLTLPNGATGTIVNDQVVLSVVVPQPQTVATPTGYTLISNTASGTATTSARLLLFRRTVVAGDTAVTVRFASAFAKTATLAVYRGVNAISPVDTRSQAVIAGTSVTVPAVTTTGPNDRLLIVNGEYNSATAPTWTVPAGTTNRVSLTGGTIVSGLIADVTQTATGSSGTQTSRLSVTANLVSVLLALKPAVASYTYNTAGSRLSGSTPGTTTRSYTYDQAERLKTAVGASYTYNGDGLRTTKVAAGTTTGYTWDLAAGLPLLLADGTTNLIYGPHGQLIEQLDNTSTPVATYVQHDQQGSTRVLTNQTAAIIGTYTYDPYGRTTAHTGSASSLRYTGQYQDNETGFYYLRARYYDPATTQFLTRDPLETQTRSAYGYAAGSPLDSSDPTGLCDLCLGFSPVNALVNFGRGASGGLTDVVANFISPGASCTVPQNRLIQAVGFVATVIATGGIAAAEEAGGAAAAEDGAGGFGRLARARMDRTLNPDRGGSLGGFSGNTTAHGAIRIGEAGFDDIDVAIIRAGSKYEQADGAFAYVAQAGKDSYNLIIQNADGAIVTAHRGWPLSDVAGMARSNGWSGW